jgi:hypothetical protein
MRSTQICLSVLGFGILVGSGLLSPAVAGTYATFPPGVSTRPSIVLVDNGPILPSQRPRYLSESSGSDAARFAQTGTPNPWGLYPIAKDEGVVTLKPGETYRTAADSDLGARAAGATHGHGLVLPTAGTVE